MNAQVKQAMRDQCHGPMQELVRCKNDDARAKGLCKGKAVQVTVCVADAVCPREKMDMFRDCKNRAAGEPRSDACMAAICRLVTCFQKHQLPSPVFGVNIERR